MGGRQGLFAVAFISGACSLLVELAGARAMAPFLGTTIYSWAAVIGFVLASLSIGYYIGGVLADRFNDRKHLAAILLGASLSTLAIPALGSVLLPFTLFTDLATGSLFGALILVPASLFYGMVSPYCIKLTNAAGEEGRSAGTLFAVSTVGSIAGALGTGFVLIPSMQITHIFVLAGALMFACCLALSGFGRKALTDAFPFAAFALIALSSSVEPPMSGDIVFSGQSPYYHLRVIDTQWNGGPARVLFLDSAASSGERPDGELAFQYMIAKRLAYPYAGDVGKALVIGAAAGNEMEDVERHFPDAEVHGVEIDPAAVALGREYFSLGDGTASRIAIDDARRFVRRSEGGYDLVLIDCFHGISPPYHLTTAEFLRELKGTMAPDGMAVVNVISSLEGPKSEAFLRFHSTFSSVFDNVAAVQTRNDTARLQNIIIVASDRDLSDFTRGHAGEIYSGPVPFREPLTDGLNPIELYATR